MIVDFWEVMRHQQVVVSCVGWLEAELLDVRFDQIRKKQMREQRQFPGFGFFLIEDEVNDFAQVWVSLLVIVLEACFQVGNRAGYCLEENCRCCF